MRPSEHKTVQARILKYAHDFGWTFDSHEEVEERRAGFRLAAAQLCEALPASQSGRDSGRNARPSLSLFSAPSFTNR